MSTIAKIIVTIVIVVVFFVLFSVIVGATGGPGGIIGIILFAAVIGALTAIWKKKKKNTDFEDQQSMGVLFKDYYAILGLEQTFDVKEVEDAINDNYSSCFKANDTKKLADVIEAQKILTNPESKEKYDIEYRLFRHWRDNVQDGTLSSCGDPEADVTRWAEYNVQDFSLANDISVARKLAEDLAHELVQTVKTAAEGAAHEVIPWVIVGVILLVFGMLIRACM